LEKRIVEEGNTSTTGRKKREEVISSAYRPQGGEKKDSGVPLCLKTLKKSRELTPRSTAVEKWELVEQGPKEWGGKTELAGGGLGVAPERVLDRQVGTIQSSGTSRQRKKGNLPVGWGGGAFPHHTGGTTANIDQRNPALSHGSFPQKKRTLQTAARREENAPHSRKGRGKGKSMA